ncbi:MAG: GAF domain-containing protein [Acidobacteriota bacterium]
MSHSPASASTRPTLNQSLCSTFGLPVTLSSTCCPRALSPPRYGCYGETTDADVLVHRDYVDGAPSMVGRYPKDSFGKVMTDRLRRGETVVVDDMDLLPGLLDSEREVTRAIHVAAHIAVTLIKDGQWVANLAVHSATPRHWSPAEVALAEDVADRTWPQPNEGARDSVIAW